MSKQLVVYKPQKAKQTPSKGKPSRQLGFADVGDLQNCESMYLRARLNPFDPSLVGKVCYPGALVKRSQKYETTWSGNVTIGTAGVGYIIWDPTYVNDKSAVFFTDATYAGTSASAFSITAGSGVNAQTMYGPYATGDFNPGDLGECQGRVVANGLRIRYTGTELNRGGNAIIVYNEQGGSLVGHTLASEQFISYPRIIPKFEAQEVALAPASSKAFEWVVTTNSFPWSLSQGATAAPYMGIQFSGVAGNTFEVQLIVFCEAAGGNVQSVSSESHAGRADVVASIDAAANEMATSSQGPDGYKEAFVSASRRIIENPSIQRQVMNAAMRIFNHLTNLGPRRYNERAFDRLLRF